MNHREVANLIAQEYSDARCKFGGFHSAHEGYGVLLEEVDEMWDAIKTNDLQHAKKEAIQVAAMALAFILEV